MGGVSSERIVSTRQGVTLSKYKRSKQYALTQEANRLESGIFLYNIHSILESRKIYLIKLQLKSFKKLASNTYMRIRALLSYIFLEKCGDTGCLMFMVCALCVWRITTRGTHV